VRPLSIRALTWLLVLSGGAVATVTGTYAAFRVFPVVREVRAATTPLMVLSSRLRDYDAWIERGAGLAQRLVVAPSPGVMDSLDRWMDRYDALAGALRGAAVPDSVLLLLAAADDAASRFAVTVEELHALLELGRRAEAVQRLVEGRRLEAQVRELAAEVQARSLDRLVVAQREVEALSRRLLWAFLLWVLGSVAVMAAAVRLVRTRVERPLRELQGGLERMAEGDLAAQLAPHADDEIGALTRQFNQMTAVLRSRAETQGQMAAASVLLANVAHEVNNPLMSIGATAEGRLADASVSGPLRRDLEEILLQARRASRLARGIVRFVRPAAAGDGGADVNEVVREALDLIAFQFAADGVACSLDLAPGLPPAELDAQKLEHVLVALLTNAHHALARSGAAERRVTVRTWARDGRVCAEVRDTGPGVPSDIRDRLFLPFVSSRAGGHIGLGLYTARLVAREAGGDLEHESPAEGPGAAFVVTLPVAPSPAPETAPSPAAARAPTLQGVTVLLVDDEPAVRSPLARFLVRRGATVREAANGHEALAALDVAGCDLIVADLRMPGMDGVALFRALRERAPELAGRTVFLSGDVSQLGDLQVGIEPDRVLPKPVELAEFERFLLQHLHSVP
jgi:signal transduction histidine kinase/CheY-like chemotaxis protein